jgi:secretion/DNA translocation related TadE-like protein
VLAVVLAALLLLGATLGLGGAAAALAAHRAGVAADLAALAAARVLPGSAAAACARANDVVRANGARLVRCTADRADVTVVAAVHWVSSHRGPGHALVSVRTARAGPAAPPPPP